jgi:16S rRNA (cytosine967-C5)-methyltransferase
VPFLGSRTPAPRRAPPQGHGAGAQPPRASADARALAWEILQRVEAGAFADALLGRQLTHSALAPRDQALATQLVYGTLAWQGYLDYLIAAFSKRSPQSLDAPVRTILRLGVFQMAKLTRIPDFAAVDTAVNLIKGFRGGAAVSLVNAVLRRAAAGWEGVTLPAAAADPVGYLSISLSHPRWLVERWMACYGRDETAALLRADNEPAPTVLRVNRRRVAPAELLRRLHEAGVAAEPAAYSSVGISVAPGGRPENLPGYADGLFSFQGEASQLVGFMLAPRPGERVLDACAAPGGKTTHLAELMDDRGEIVALDANARGLDRLRSMTRRLGLTSVRATPADTRTWQPAAAAFDAVLVDAPCSGLGTLREHPEVKWRRTPADLAALAQLQGALLTHAATLVRPEGALVYATCTLSDEENDGQVAAFLAAHPDFGVDDPRADLPEPARGLVGGDGVLRTFPHRHGLDGFFAVRLKRHAPHGIVRP